MSDRPILPLDLHTLNGNADPANADLRRPVATFDSGAILLADGTVVVPLPPSLVAVLREEEERQRRLLALEVAAIVGGGPPVERPPPPAAQGPRWDRTRRTLFLGDKVACRYRREAPRQFALLDLFEQKGWPQTVDCPRNFAAKNAVDNLNRKAAASHLRFGLADGDTRVTWLRLDS
jgi:hypothetical protein